MKNPWLGFKHSEQMVHQLDEASVKEYNLTSKRDYQYLLNLAPEPWIGNIDGNLLVLYSNPGATRENLNGVVPEISNSIYNDLHKLDESDFEVELLNDYKKVSNYVIEVTSDPEELTELISDANAEIEKKYLWILTA